VQHPYTFLSVLPQTAVSNFCASLKVLPRDPCHSFPIPQEPAGSRFSVSRFQLPDDHPPHPRIPFSRHRHWSSFMRVPTPPFLPTAVLTCFSFARFFFPPPSQSAGLFYTIPSYKQEGLRGKNFFPFLPPLFTQKNFVRRTPFTMCHCRFSSTRPVFAGTVGTPQARGERPK